MIRRCKNSSSDSNSTHINTASDGHSGNSTDMINRILGLKYNRDNVHVYQNRLSKITRSDNFTIRAYVNGIEINCPNVGMCLGWNDQIINSKIEEISLKGLE